ncbi:hypothetical protein LTR16_006152, partial [Cryomyces antarcticus]
AVIVSVVPGDSPNDWIFFEQFVVKHICFELVNAIIARSVGNDDEASLTEQFLELVVEAKAVLLVPDHLLSSAVLSTED